MDTGKRQAATEQLQGAVAAINTMFGRKDDLIAARDRFVGIEPLGPDDDPIPDVGRLLGHAKQLDQALEELRSAVVAASEHRRRFDLASDVGTRPSLLFERTKDQSPVVGRLRPVTAVDPEPFDSHTRCDVTAAVST